MEIIDYLRIARRRLLLLIGIPLVAAVVGAAIFWIQPQQYSAQAYIAANGAVGGSAGGQFSGSRASDDFVAAFQAAASAPQVVNAISQDTKVSTAALSSGLSVAQVGGSSQVTMTYASSDKGTIQPVLRSATTRILSFLFQPNVAVAKGQVATATAALGTANKAISKWESDNKVSSPDAVYQDLLNRIDSLQQQEISLAANGNSAGAAAAKAVLAQTQSQVSILGPKLTVYHQLVQNQSSANTTLTAAEQTFQQAQAQAQAAQPSKVAHLSATQTISRVGGLVKTVVPIAAAGFVLALIIVALLEYLSRSKTRRNTTATEAAEQGMTHPVPATGPDGRSETSSADHRSLAGAPAESSASAGGGGVDAGRSPASSRSGG